MLRGLFGSHDAIDVGEAARRLALDEIVLVDVREPSEWRSGRAGGATHVPLSAIPQKLTALAGHGKPIAFICRSGSRSGTACSFARSQGLEALNVSGGMGAWQRAGLPVASG